MKQVTTLEELLPLVRDAATAREFGAAVIANVPQRLKFKLACEARDALGLQWTDGTLRNWLKPICHSGTWEEQRRKANRVASREAMQRRRESSPHACRKYERDYKNKRYAEDVSFALRVSVKGRVNAALRAAVGNPRKTRPTLHLLGCSGEEYRVYLESLFEPGMSWDNWGKWHVDHIVPIAAHDLSTEEGQRAAFHYTNTQPMWASENRSKGSLHEGVRHRHVG